MGGGVLGEITKAESTTLLRVIKLKRYVDLRSVTIAYFNKCAVVVVVVVRGQYLVEKWFVAIQAPIHFLTKSI